MIILSLIKKSKIVLPVFMADSAKPVGISSASMSEFSTRFTDTDFTGSTKGPTIHDPAEFGSTASALTWRIHISGPEKAFKTLFEKARQLQITYNFQYFANIREHKDRPVIFLVFFWKVKKLIHYTLPSRFLVLVIAVLTIFGPENRQKSQITNEKAKF